LPSTPKATPEDCSSPCPHPLPIPISSTIVLQVKGPLQARTHRPLPETGWSFSRCPPAEARLHGTTFQYENGREHDNIGYWFKSEEWLTGNSKVPHPRQIRSPHRYRRPCHLRPSTFTLGSQTIHLHRPCHRRLFPSSNRHPRRSRDHRPWQSNPLPSTPSKEGCKPMNLQRPSASKPITVQLTLSL